MSGNSLRIVIDNRGVSKGDSGSGRIYFNGELVAEIGTGLGHYIDHPEFPEQPCPKLGATSFFHSVEIEEIK